jgi:dTDP-4-dehydrorhamnose reductase
LPIVIENLINKNVVGLYHVTSDNPITKYELLNLFKKYSNKKDNIAKIDGHVSDKSLVDTRKIISIDIPPYDTMIQQMFEYIKQNNIFYKHYNFNYD